MLTLCEVPAKFKFIDDTINWEAMGIEKPEGETRIMPSVLVLDNVIGIYGYSETDTAIKYVSDEKENVLLVAIPYDDFVKQLEQCVGEIHRIHHWEKVEE